METRAYNFSAGPSMLPEAVLKEAAAEMLNYRGSGESVMEMSHRSPVFKEIIETAEADLRKLMNIPDNYKVMFVQGGGTLQFSMVPLNLMKGSGKADYLVTGAWAKKAAKEAEKFGDVKVVASSEADTFSYIPKPARGEFRDDADYVYICHNNTIYGTHYNTLPDVGELLLVSDMSSCILSEEIDVTKFGLIFAGVQKNIAPAGMTLVIMREDLIGKADEKCPVYLDYKTHADNGSMYNTPPCYTIYMAGKVFRHILDNGGIAPLHEQDVKKAGLLYDYLDRSRLFKSPVAKEDRSLMNVTFVTGNEDLDKAFIAGAKEQGMHNLGGHRSVGGMRASIYNAMPMEGVEKLVAYMEKFEKENL